MARVEHTLSGVLCALFVAALPAHAQEGGVVDLDLGDDPSIVDSGDRRRNLLGELEPVRNEAFGPGERLVYSVRYGPVRAGEATLSVIDTVPVNGRACHRVVGTAASNDFFSSIFRVEDRMQSFLDTELLLPWRFEKDLREGNYRAHQRIELDQVNRVATYHDGAMVEMDRAAHDMLSSLYYLRTMRLAPGSRAGLRTHADKKNVDLEIEVIGRERVDTPAGGFDCLVVEPKILLDTGIYDHEKGKLQIYLTDDRRKMPVLFKVKVFFGSLVLTLTDFTAGDPAARSNGLAEN